MPTRPHTNPENGYSLRIGKNLPSEAANLAYVHTDGPEPEKNLLVLNLADTIPENRDKDAKFEAELYAQKENSAYFLYQNGKKYEAENSELLLATEMSLGLSPQPLFYYAQVNFPLDIRNLLLRTYHSSRRVGEPRRITNDELAQQDFVYDGNAIQITKESGFLLDEKDAYKIIVRPNSKEDATFYVLSTFSGKKESYRITYPSYQNGKRVLQTETLNPVPHWQQAEDLSKEYAFSRSYTLKANPLTGRYFIQLGTGGYGAYERLDVSVRNPHVFQYQILSDVETRFSKRNPYEIKIGLLYTNDNIPNAIPLTSSLRNLAHNNRFLPDYLSFKNPHRKSGENLPESAEYWMASLQMPKEHFLDYDILILAGYGQKDLSLYRENIQAFLENGGTFLVDNNGTGVSVLDFKTSTGIQTFVSDIGFSKTNNGSGSLKYGTESDFKERYYPAEKTLIIGNVRPTMQFFNEETANDWDKLVVFENNSPAIIRRKMGGVGQLVLSNLGLMNDLVFGKEATYRLMTNMLLSLLEKRSFRTPVFNEQVLHRLDLYKEDYTDKLGKVRYADDQSDHDVTQIVAKKELAEHVSDVAVRYLPYAYQRPLSATYRPIVKNNSVVQLDNPGFESNSTVKSWVDTTASAIPGTRYVVLSKGTISKASISTQRKSGKQSARLEFENTRGFFEKEINDLPAGSYIYRISVKTEGVTAGGISVYDANGDTVATSPNLTGTKDWHTLSLHFKINTSQTIYLRFGSSELIATGNIYFDDIELEAEATVRMTPEGDGSRPLYAYAVETRNDNRITNANPVNSLLLRTEHRLMPTVRIRSFVYKWHPEEQRFEKEYGKENAIRTNVALEDGEKVMGRLIELVPGKNAGYEWRNDENVFYEIELDSLQDESRYLNVSVYDPSNQTYYYSPTGEWVINREDLWWNGIESTVQLRISSTADALQLVGQAFELSYPNEEKIALLFPNTRDERDRWYPRINKGSFSRTHVSAKDWEDAKDAARETFYSEYLSGTHQYELPEYARQSFYPHFGYRLVEDEPAHYIDRRTIQVASTPLAVSDRKQNLLLENPRKDKKTYRAAEMFWSKTDPIRIYWDKQLVLTGYEINHKDGIVVFKNPVPDSIDTIRAEVTLNTVRVEHRKLMNTRIKNEQLKRIDNTTLQFNKSDIALSPHPVLYRDGQPVHPGEYWIDYDSGLLHFYQDNRKNIFADYSYYIKEELEHTDVDWQTGKIKLKKAIYFRDEILVDYMYKENALEYKGYRDPETGVFQHLDLNPTAGHTYTKRIYQENGKFLHFQEESSEKLLNKEIFFYLLPTFSRYINKTKKEDYPMRHCFNESEWHKIKAATPEALLIGKIHVRENTDIENAVVMDARRLGGGLKESLTQEEIEKRVGFTSAFWDIGSFDGLAYYENGVTVIQLPESLLDSNGGTFSEKQIEKIVSKYIAFGVYPLIEFVKNETED